MAGMACWCRCPSALLLQLAYLQSYENMGAVRYECLSGCKCMAKVIDAHDDDHKASVTVVRPILVRAADGPSCGPGIPTLERVSHAGVRLLG